LLLAMGGALLSTLLPRPSYDVVSTDYLLDAQGRLVRFTRDNRGLLSVTDLAGKPFPEHADTADVTEAYTRMATGGDDVALVLDQQDGFPFGGGYRSEARYLRLVFQFPGPWYYLYDEDFLVGYSRQDNAVSGYAGPDGFRRRED